MFDRRSIYRRFAWLLATAVCLLAGCSKHPEELAQKLRDHRNRLQDVLSAVGSDSDALGKDRGSFLEFLQEVRDDPDTWPATLVLDSEPAISERRVAFSFRYRKGITIKFGGPEDQTFFDPGQPGVVTLAVDRGDDNFDLVDVTVPDEIKDLDAFENWLTTLPTLTSEQLTPFKFLVLAGTSRVVIESIPETGSEPAGHRPQNARDPLDESPWGMVVPVQKMEARRAGPAGPARIWQIAMISRVVEIVVGYPRGRPVIQRAVLSEERK